MVNILFVNRVLGLKQTHLKTLERILIVIKFTALEEKLFRINRKLKSYFLPIIKV